MSDTTSDEKKHETPIDGPAPPAHEGREGEAEEKGDGIVSRAVDATLYSLSLPERVARGMIGCTSGILKETARVAVPNAMKGTRFYDITVRKMLSFLVDDVGKLRTTESKDDEGGEDSQYLMKKAVGNVIDVAGLTVLHLSPLWVLALFSDVTMGTKKYLNTLADELKKQGVLEKSATIDSIDSILDSLQKTSGILADNLDTPPLTVEQLKESVKKLRAEANRVDLAKAVPTEDLAAIWDEIQKTASTEGRSLLEVSNALAVMTFSQFARAGKGAYTSVKVGFDLVNDNVVDYYVQALDEIHQKGYYQSVLDAYEPYVHGLRHLFATETETTTEQILKGKPFRRMWRTIRSWFARLLRKRSTG